METTHHQRRHAPAPLLRHRRDSLMPIVAAALSVRGDTYTHVSEKSEPPLLHPLVGEFLAGLPVEHRERYTGRCPEAVLLSQFLDQTESGRSGRAARKSFGEGDARKALRGAKMTTVRIREEGDPAHGTHQPPCRSCEPLLAHFGVKTISLHPRTK
ncbi:YwqJ-related putative deaminase [Streptacidiphilus jiangxiensis]|uniref:YwqJ-like deaminase n=1 Tax=Streptacidiphilus jiangxiensis TaxID=235985 RepID=A0A1H7FEG4_STRJI|nr:YwqJ-related putative deaminase [Streptacidiphilus jiangxiensis]SEK24573.1 YwqJ-like deaminase [Streptacidiphilus jiangxiensis]